MDPCYKYEQSNIRWFAGLAAITYCIALYFVCTNTLYFAVYVCAGIAFFEEMTYSYDWSFSLFKCNKGKTINFQEYKTCMLGVFAALTFLLAWIEILFIFIDAVVENQADTTTQKVIDVSLIVLYIALASIASYSVGKLTSSILLEHYYEWNK